jgi:hypothetical protein
MMLIILLFFISTFTFQSKPLIMKKKILLSLGIIGCTIFSLKAQIEKGNLLLGGSFGLNSNNSNPTYTTSNANITPHIGLGIGKNSVIGLGFGFSYSSNSGMQSNLDLSTNIFYKKYFVIKNKLGYYLQLHGGVTVSTSKYTVIDSSGNANKTSYKEYSYSLGIIPGIYYEVAPWILLTADVGGLGYVYSNNGGRNWSSNFNVGFFNSFTFGVEFILGKKQSN